MPCKLLISAIPLPIANQGTLPININLLLYCQKLTNKDKKIASPINIASPPNNPNKNADQKVKPIMSINIRQLPGLKESHSTGKLNLPYHLSHSKNRSIDISSSNLQHNSQLRKIIDANGNVRYKFINKSTNTEAKDGEVQQMRSFYRGSYNPYVVRNSSVRVLKD